MNNMSPLLNDQSRLLAAERSGAATLAAQGQPLVDPVAAGGRSMRVLMVHEACGGGSGRQALDLSEGLMSLGHRVSLAYSGRRVESDYLDRARALPFEHLIDTGMRREVSLHDIGDLMTLHRFIRSAGPFDIVHAHSSKAGALARLAAPRTAARIYTPHAFRTMDPTIGAVAGRVYGAVERLLGRLATDALICVGPEEAAHAIDLGVPAEKVRLVLNGVAPFVPPSRASVRAQLGISDQEVVVGFVGRLTAQKDPLRFCRAIAAAHAQDPRIVGLIIGEGELARAAEAIKAPVRMLGRRDAREYMGAFDALALTSRYEGLPYVLLEALQLGLPVVSTDVGGVRSVVRDRESGHVLSVDASPDEFAQTLLKLGSVKHRQELSRNARLVSPAFTTDRMIYETKIVYESSIKTIAPKQPRNNRPIRPTKGYREPFATAP
jgi:glycosyltransferase involved in cell wall biosynthesis